MPSRDCYNIKITKKAYKIFLRAAYLIYRGVQLIRTMKFAEKPSELPAPCGWKILTKKGFFYSKYQHDSFIQDLT